MEHVYLSGRMRGEFMNGHPTFRKATDELRARGYVVTSPHERDLEQWVDPDQAVSPERYAQLLADDIQVIRGVDAVVALNNWTRSPGAKTEVAYAQAIGIPVLSYPDLKPIFKDGGELKYDDAGVRVFESGATRDLDDTKLDYEGFLSPVALEAFASYMHKNRIQKDGSLRASDNWQKGIPLDAYMKSGWRHFMDWWKVHRNLPTETSLEDTLCAIIFNAQGYLHERLK